MKIKFDSEILNLFVPTDDEDDGSAKYFWKNLLAETEYSK